MPRPTPRDAPVTNANGMTYYRRRKSEYLICERLGFSVATAWSASPGRNSAMTTSAPCGLLWKDGREISRMARLVYGLSQSLDGYVDHTRLGPPPPAAFRHFIEMVRDVSGFIYGRRT